MCAGRNRCSRGWRAAAEGRRLRVRGGRGRRPTADCGDVRTTLRKHWSRRGLAAFTAQTAKERGQSFCGEGWKQDWVPGCPVLTQMENLGLGAAGGLAHTPAGQAPSPAPVSPKPFPVAAADHPPRPKRLALCFRPSLCEAAAATRAKEKRHRRGRLARPPWAGPGAGVREASAVPGWRAPWRPGLRLRHLEAVSVGGGKELGRRPPGRAGPAAPCSREHSERIASA